MLDQLTRPHRAAPTDSITRLPCSGLRPAISLSCGGLDGAPARPLRAGTKTGTQGPQGK
jgi:hypothetical protein